MRKERNEVLKTDSQIKVAALIKTILSIIIVDVFVAAVFKCFIYFGEVSSWLWTYYFAIVFILDIYFIFFFYSFAKKDEEDKRSKIFAKKYLSSEKWVEVIPIKVEKYSDFIMNLPDTAKFYAIMTKNNKMIVINIKFNHEEEGRDFDKIYPSDFMKYYKIKVDENKKKQN